MRKQTLSTETATLSSLEYLQNDTYALPPIQNIIIRLFNLFIEHKDNVKSQNEINLFQLIKNIEKANIFRFLNLDQNKNIDTNTNQDWKKIPCFFAKKDEIFSEYSQKKETIFQTMDSLPPTFSTIDNAIEKIAQDFEKNNGKIFGASISPLTKEIHSKYRITKETLMTDIQSLNEFYSSNTLIKNSLQSNLANKTEEYNVISEEKNDLASRFFNVTTELNTSLLNASGLFKAQDNTKTKPEACLEAIKKGSDELRYSCFLQILTTNKELESNSPNKSKLADLLSYLLKPTKETETAVSIKEWIENNSMDDTKAVHALKPYWNLKPPSEIPENAQKKYYMAIATCFNEGYLGLSKDFKKAAEFNSLRPDKQKKNETPSPTQK